MSEIIATDNAGNDDERVMDMVMERGFRTNEEFFSAVKFLLNKIRRINQESWGPLMFAINVSMAEEFTRNVKPGKAITNTKALEDVKRIHQKLIRAIQITESNEQKPPFYSFCKEQGLNYTEMLVLSLVLKEDDDSIRHKLRPQTVMEIVAILGRVICPVDDVKACFRPEGRLRINNIIKLTGSIPVIPECYVTFNVKYVKRIFPDDYDPTVMAEKTGIFEDDGAGDTEIAVQEPVSRGLYGIVLPAAAKEMILNGLLQARHSEIFLDRMGFRGMTGRGVSMLFSGPPGTGKTETARAIASEIKHPLMFVNYAHLENKYLGETEKNIVNCFVQACRKNAVLVFDEADAVCYSRSERERSWSNRAVSILLQEIEKFDGIVILTTNSGRLLDPALERRMSIKILFPMPDAQAREEIFRKLAPVSAESNIEYRELSRRFELSGGQIKNVWLNAGRMALKRTNGDPETKITTLEIEAAIKMEIAGAEVMETRLDGSKPEGYA